MTCIVRTLSKCDISTAPQSSVLYIELLFAPKSIFLPLGLRGFNTERK